MKTRLVLFSICFLLSAITAAQDKAFRISFDINGSKTPEIRKGLPLVLDIGLSSSRELSLDEILGLLPDSLRESPAVSHKLDSLYAPFVPGPSRKQWFQEIFFDTDSPGQPRSFKTTMHKIQPFPEEQKMLHHGQNYQLYMGVDPETTIKWKAGTVQMKAGFVLNPGDTIWSEQVSIRISDPQIKRMTDYSREHLSFVAGYWLRRGECKKAEAMIEYLEGLEPGSASTRILKARWYECNNEIESALDLYMRSLNDYLRQSSDDVEPPVHLILKIHELQDLLIMNKE